MIHEEICTYEVCKLAKEKGFPQQYDSLTHIYGGEDSFNLGIDLKYEKSEGTLFDITEWNPSLNDIAAPTQSLLQRWLREKKNIHIEIVATACGYFWIADKTNGTSITDSDLLDRGVNNGGCWDTYEFALEDALKYILERLI